MSQFMICKSDIDLTAYSCARIADSLKTNGIFARIVNELLGDNLDDIWELTDIDFLFTQAQNKPFEDSELNVKLSALFDVCDVLILWYSDFYQDLDCVNTKEQFLSAVAEGVNDPSGLCECYLYVNCC